MIKIPAGTYRIGTDTKAGFEEDQEGPKIQVEMASLKSMKRLLPIRCLKHLLRQQAM